MKLYYSHNLNPRVAVAAARHLGAKLDFIRARPRDPNEEPAFAAINPNTLVPVLVEDNGAKLWETDAIVCRLSQRAGSDFWRTNDSQAAMIMWISWATHHLTSAASIFYWENIVRPMFDGPRASPSVLEDGMRNFQRFSGVLDVHLEGRDWVLDDRLSYADFRVATALPFADAAGLSLTAFANVRRWHERLLQIEAWRDPFDGLA